MVTTPAPTNAALMNKMAAAPTGVQAAAQRSLKAKRAALLKVRSRTSSGNQFHLDPRESDGSLSKKNPPTKGKYIGKERYKGLTKGTPKGKYKGKYIGPDRFKGDAEAYNAYKQKKRLMKRIGNKRPKTIINPTAPLPGNDPKKGYAL